MKTIHTKCAKIFKIFEQLNPRPTTELNYSSNFELLVAVILSAQATDISVNKVTQKLFKLANIPKAILDLGLKNLEQHIKTIGLYQAKAKNIMAMAKILDDKYNSKVPETFEELIELPGVGRKTANVILNTLFGKAVIAVDTHVFRVANRLGIANAANPLDMEKQLQQNIPNKYKHNAHHWLILHGRYICKARKPLCPTCPVNKYCDYFRSLA